MCKLLIGCPVTDRSWILPEWFKHVNAACDKAGIEPKFLFLVPPDDQETINAIVENSDATIAVDHNKAYPGDHKWSQARYRTMTALRNELLGLVRAKHPDFFFSLDSDILLHPDSIVNLLEDMENSDYWAIASKCFLSRSTDKYANAGSWTPSGRTFTRATVPRLVKVNVIMAAKFMRPEAYNIDYVVHSQGEDFGWSAAVMRAGGTLAFDGRVANKHVMDRERLYEYDKRIGW